MKRWLARLAVLITVFVITSLIIATPALGVTAQPDSAPTAEFYVFRNLLETGDWLLLAYQNIPYAATPDDPISSTFMWRMMNGATDLGTAQPYAFNDNGYGYNVTSMYWSAADVTAAGMVWGTAYTMRLSENPPQFAAPVNYDFSLSTADYNALTASADVKAALASRILIIGADLDIRWGLGATYSLLTETETGTVLSVYGEAFFRGAIYGLQGLCPQIFAYVINDLTITDRTWTGTYVTTLENQYSGTWVDTAKSAGASLFGTTYDLTAWLITLLACAVLGIITVVLSGDFWHAIGDMRTGLIVATRLGFFNLGFLGLLAALAVIYGASRLWGVMK